MLLCHPLQVLLLVGFLASSSLIPVATWNDIHGITKYWGGKYTAMKALACHNNVDLLERGVMWVYLKKGKFQASD